MDLAETGLRLVGAFYVFAGLVATRAALTSHFLDRALAAITLEKTDAVERHRFWWLLTSAALVLAGGAALMLLLDMSVWLFLASCAGQAAYLFGLAPHYFDVRDPPDPAGRRQTVNAFVIYGAATAFVLWGAYTGRLLAASELPWPLWVLAGVAAAGYAFHTGKLLWTRL